MCTHNNIYHLYTYICFIHKLYYAQAQNIVYHPGGDKENRGCVILASLRLFMTTGVALAYSGDGQIATHILITDQSNDILNRSNFHC